ncbi:c2H2-type domain-containing protein [Caerostris extrusa]|uniref:C2H2-type domain-containing protein n=1 Tax=Caerostris extrusa TaxID=172846 RepID=A0AAV4QG06_CAEEX|nr:c2H2-type domain-containing protein [Caerostris extrusa]
MPLITRSDDSYDPHLCHICTKRFLPGEIRVRDHNHWGSGRINGLAHQACNLNYRATYFIPVVIHNSRNYDNRLILKRRRHAIANNPYIAENYDETLPSNYILALDANNLYGFAMSQFLPVGNFRWLNSEELSKFFLELEEDSDIGYY